MNAKSVLLELEIGSTIIVGALAKPYYFDSDSKSKIYPEKIVTVSTGSGKGVRLKFVKIFGQGQHSILIAVPARSSSKINTIKIAKALWSGI